jgi:hypothetical protein
MFAVTSHVTSVCSDGKAPAVDARTNVVTTVNMVDSSLGGSK